MRDSKNVYLGGENDSLESVNPRHIEKFLSKKLILLVLTMLVVILWLMKR